MKQALDWLKSYYWEPQKKAIPYQGAGTTSIREEIKFKLSELALSLKFKQSPSYASSPKGKRTYETFFSSFLLVFLTSDAVIIIHIAKFLIYVVNGLMLLKRILH